MGQSRQALFIKYLNDQCTEQEILELLNHFKFDIHEQELKQAILAELKQEVLADLESVDVTRRLGDIKGQLQLHIQKSKTEAPKPTKRLWLPIGIAASLFLVVSTGMWYYFNKEASVNHEIHYAGDAVPGKMGATLTLANGKQIQLGNARKGELATESGINISKTADGQLVYEIVGDSQNSGFNTLTTARGETYQVKLPDGSKVWLNAASSLTYQASLNEQGLRRVKLNGEAYFEIHKDATHPFIVASAGQEVEVLGTHFNVKAYEGDRNDQTTLLEGSVRLNVNNKQDHTKSTFVLAPGEQAISNGRVVIENVDLEEAVAWKNGNTVFKDQSLEEIMLELSRWYDIEVVYAPGAPIRETFSGAVSKSRKLSAVLERMQNTGSVKFTIEGKTVTVMK